MEIAFTMRVNFSGMDQRLFRTEKILLGRRSYPHSAIFNRVVILIGPSSHNYLHTESEAMGHTLEFDLFPRGKASVDLVKALSTRAFRIMLLLCRKSFMAFMLLFT